MLTATPPCHPPRRFTARLSIPSFLLTGWLVDVTGSYTATFFLSGAAMLASALTLAIIVGIRHCRRVSLAKKAKHQPLPWSCPNKRTILLPSTGEISQANTFWPRRKQIRSKGWSKIKMSVDNHTKPLKRNILVLEVPSRTPHPVFSVSIRNIWSSSERKDFSELLTIREDQYQLLLITVKACWHYNHVGRVQSSRLWHSCPLIVRPQSTQAHLSQQEQVTSSFTSKSTSIITSGVAQRWLAIVTNKYFYLNM